MSDVCLSLLYHYRCFFVRHTDTRMGKKLRHIP